jgi:hypothetical protein
MSPPPRANRKINHWASKIDGGSRPRGTSRVKQKDLRPRLSVIAGGESLVSHAGGVLLVETVRRSGLSGQLTGLLGRWRRPLATHGPGKIVADLAVAVALGGDAAADVAVLRAQPGVFGPVASDPTMSRLVATLAADVDDAVAAISAARAAARERVRAVAGAPVLDGRVVIDLDATLLAAHSEKQDASGPASLTSTSTPPSRSSRRRRGRRRIRPAVRAPPNTRCRSSPATAPGSPRPPA